VNALVELHPLKAWRRALHTSCPSPRPLAVGIGISGAVLYSCVRSVECRSDNENQITVRRVHDHSPQLEHHGRLRELHAATFWYQTLLVMLSPAFGLKHWYHAVTKSACFSSRLATTTMGIMLTFCNQYKSSKTTCVVYTGQWFLTTYVLDLGGGATYSLHEYIRYLWQWCREYCRCELWVGYVDCCLSRL